MLQHTGPQHLMPIAASHIPFSFSAARNQINVSSLFTPLLLLLFHLPVPPAPVKANMLEMSLEHSQCLEARLRIAGVRALVSLQEYGFNACHQASWVYYSAAWQRC